MWGGRRRRKMGRKERVKEGESEEWKRLGRREMERERGRWGGGRTETEGDKEKDGNEEKVVERETRK